MGNIQIHGLKLLRKINSAAKRTSMVNRKLTKLANTEEMGRTSRGK